MQHNAAGAKRPSSAGTGKKAAPSKAEQVSTSYLTLVVLFQQCRCPGQVGSRMLGAVRDSIVQEV